MVCAGPCMHHSATVKVLTHQHNNTLTHTNTNNITHKTRPMRPSCLPLRLRRSSPPCTQWGATRRSSLQHWQRWSRYVRGWVEGVEAWVCRLSGKSECVRVCWSVALLFCSVLSLACHSCSHPHSLFFAPILHFPFTSTTHHPSTKPPLNTPGPLH